MADLYGGARLEKQRERERGRARANQGAREPMCWHKGCREPSAGLVSFVIFSANPLAVCDSFDSRPEQGAHNIQLACSSTFLVQIPPAHPPTCPFEPRLFRPHPLARGAASCRLPANRVRVGPPGGPGGRQRRDRRDHELGGHGGGMGGFG